MAAPPADYRAGLGIAGRARVVALLDRRGSVAVFAEADFTVTRAISDLVAARVMKAYGVERGGLLLHSAARGEPAPDDLFDAIGGALASPEAVNVSYNDTGISLSGLDGKCVVRFFPVSPGRCTPGAAVRPPIRYAFQMVDLAQDLQKRGQVPATYPVQAIAVGRQVTVLGLGGDAALERFRSVGVIVVPFCNDAAAPPDDPRIAAAVREMLGRISR